MLYQSVSVAVSIVYSHIYYTLATNFVTKKLFCNNDVQCQVQIILFEPELSLSVKLKRRHSLVTVMLDCVGTFYTLLQTLVH